MPPAPSCLQNHFDIVPNETPPTIPSRFLTCLTRLYCPTVLILQLLSIYPDHSASGDRLIRRLLGSLSALL
jgi:hypothetical protein